MQFQNNRYSRIAQQKLLAYLRRNSNRNHCNPRGGQTSLPSSAYDEVCTRTRRRYEDFYLPTDKSDPEESYEEVYITDFLEDWVAENFDELFELLEADEHEKTVTDVKTYIVSGLSVKKSILVM